MQYHAASISSEEPLAMNPRAWKSCLSSLRRLSPIVPLLALCACTTAGPRPAERGIARLDGTRIDPAVLTERIEALARAAKVQGLTVTVFNDARTVYSHAFGAADLPAG